MERPWLILGSFLRVARAGRGAAAEAVHAGGEAQDAVIGLGVHRAQLEQRVVEVDDDDTEAAAAAAEAAQAGGAAAEPDFTIAVNPPPHVTFLTARISHPKPPAVPDRNPTVLASGPFCLLAQFSAEPLREDNKFYYFNPPESHLVLIRHFHYGADGRIAASAELVPDRGDDVPKLLSRKVETVGLLCDDDDRSYLIAELKVTSATDSIHHDAELVCYRSVLGAWSRNPLECPLPHEQDGYGNRDWVPHGAVALGSRVMWFDLSWGILSLDFNLQKSEFRLDFSHLPPGRALGVRKADIYGRRCIAVSANLVRYVEIIGDPNPNSNGGAATVSMWSLVMGHGHNGRRWTENYRVTIQEIWNSQSYAATRLPRITPLLAAVSPVDPNVVYFTVNKLMFGLNVPKLRVLHCEPIARELTVASRRNLITWNLGPGREVVIRHVSPDLQEHGFADRKDERPQDPMGKGKAPAII